MLIPKLKGVTWTFKLFHANPEPGTASIYLVFYDKGLHPRQMWLCGWAQRHSPHTLPIHQKRLFQHILQHSSVPEASYHHPFLFEPGIILLLSVGTRLNCYLQSNERKTWTLRRTFPSKEDNTSVPFIRGKKGVEAVWHFGSKTCKWGRCEEDGFQGEYFPTSAQAVVKQLRSFTTVLSLVGWLGSRTLQKIYLQSLKEPE